MSTSQRARWKAHLDMAMTNPAWLIMDTISRFPSTRRLARSVQRGPSGTAWDIKGSMLAPFDIDRAVRELENDGFCSGLCLPPDVVEELRNYAGSGLCYGDADITCGFRYADRAEAERISGRSFSKAVYYFPDAVRPTIDRIESDPALNALAAGYIHANPVKTGHRLWWTFASPEESYDMSITTSFFHYDKDDYTAVRFFFHITDVDESAGPHVVVRGSHNNKRLNQLVSLGERNDADIAEQYGKENLVTITGPSGTGFCEDPYCFHKATRPTRTDRLMLEVKFAARDYGIFPPPDRNAARTIVG